MSSSFPWPLPWTVPQDGYSKRQRKAERASADLWNQADLRNQVRWAQRKVQKKMQAQLATSSEWAPPDTRACGMRKGDKVELRQLAKQELNGLVGKIIGDFDRAGGRFRVQVGARKIKVQNAPSIRAASLPPTTRLWFAHRPAPAQRPSR